MPIYVNVPELREHLAKTGTELEIAQELSGKIRRLQYYESLRTDHHCLLATYDAKRVEEKLSQLQRTMLDFCDDAEELIEKNKLHLQKAADSAEEHLRKLK